jgi:4-carboxymuconolactone decarboxylase
MTGGVRTDASLASLDPRVRQLVRIAGVVAGASEGEMRAVMVDAKAEVDSAAVEEIILQSYLFAGFPRALNAARAWRAISGLTPVSSDPDVENSNLDEWRARGETTCRIVYGESYEKLRDNIRFLHPALDEWMIVDGYGKVLSRPGVDLKTRELCVVAACAVSGQQRQLHSHLRGALNAGATKEEISGAIEAISDMISVDERDTYNLLLGKVVRDYSASGA